MPVHDPRRARKHDPRSRRLPIRTSRPRSALDRDDPQPAMQHQKQRESQPRDTKAAEEVRGYALVESTTCPAPGRGCRPDNIPQLAQNNHLARERQPDQRARGSDQNGGDARSPWPGLSLGVVPGPANGIIGTERRSPPAALYRESGAEQGTGAGNSAAARASATAALDLERTPGLRLAPSGPMWRAGNGQNPWT